MATENQTTDLLNRMQAEAETWSAEEPERALWLEAKAEIERLRAAIHMTCDAIARRIDEMPDEITPHAIDAIYHPILVLRDQASISGACKWLLSRQ